ncbi:DNA uptake protein ComE-like DNA-binding protein [Methylobacterium aerolatum]|uniref:DNA uptake protein ComE-like DNA-binding protein n=1 Tax=Methylobacterium aerolatum TaxID=418708 RepID=A0ABU0I293_9HYPH|nr:DNA uptake protein ComE-like DNA-binding protein [Methylobacterium aerolatum]
MLLIAGALAALVQYWLPSTPAVPPTGGSGAAAVEPGAPPVRQILPMPETARPAPPPEAPPPGVPATAQPAVPPAAQATPPALRPGAVAASPRTASPPADAPPLRLPSDATAATPAPVPQADAEVAEARATEGPAAIALIDLNTASVADLNRLRGGGNIGRAIVAKRPYAAVSDLLTKRVLSRSVFERIREQVTVH